MPQDFDYITNTVTYMVWRNQQFQVLWRMSVCRNACVHVYMYCNVMRYMYIHISVYHATRFECAMQMRYTHMYTRHFPSDTAGTFILFITWICPPPYSHTRTRTHTHTRARARFLSLSLSHTHYLYMHASYKNREC